MRLNWLPWVVFLTIVGCVDPIPLTSIQYDELLVVEGYITSDFKPQEIKISKTTPLNEKKVVVEAEAVVSISDNQGNTFPCTETAPGIYSSSPFAGVVGRKYQLHFTTKDNKAYASEEMAMKDVPEVGEITGIYPSPEPYASSGIQLYLSSPDPGNLSSYYRWEYEETYEIQTPLQSQFIWLGGNNVNIRELPVDRCWHNDTSRVILIKDNSHLSQGGVTAFPLRFIPSEGREMIVKYSILVRQYPLDEKMYRYWELLKKVNESQGTLFDIQPGLIEGNIHSVDNPNDRVLGYFDAGVIRSKRAFFTPSQFASNGFVPINYFGVCDNINPAIVKFEDIGVYMDFNSRGLDIVSAGADDEGPYYIIWPKLCCNCTFDGSNIMPDFWQ